MIPMVFEGTQIIAAPYDMAKFACLDVRQIAFCLPKPPTLIETGQDRWQGTFRFVVAPSSRKVQSSVANIMCVRWDASHITINVVDTNKLFGVQLNIGLAHQEVLPGNESHVELQYKIVVETQIATEDMCKLLVEQLIENLTKRTENAWQTMTKPKTELPGTVPLSSVTTGNVQTQGVPNRQPVQSLPKSEFPGTTPLPSATTGALYAQGAPNGQPVQSLPKTEFPGTTPLPSATTGALYAQDIPNGQPVQQLPKTEFPGTSPLSSATTGNVQAQDILQDKESNPTNVKDFAVQKKHLIQPSKFIWSWHWYLALLVASAFLLFWPILPVQQIPLPLLSGCILVFTALLTSIMYIERAPVILIFSTITAAFAIVYLPGSQRLHLSIYTLLWLAVFLSQSLWHREARETLNTYLHSILGLAGQAAVVGIVFWLDQVGNEPAALFYLGAAVTLVFAIQIFIFAYWLSFQYGFIQHISNYIAGLFLSLALSWFFLDIDQQFGSLPLFHFLSLPNCLALPPATYLVFIASPHLLCDDTVTGTFAIGWRTFPWRNCIGWGATIVGGVFLLLPLLTTAFGQLSPFYSLVLIGEGFVLLMLGLFAKGFRDRENFTGKYLRFGAFSMIPIAVVYMIHTRSPFTILSISFLLIAIVIIVAIPYGRPRRKA